MTCDKCKKIIGYQDVYYQHISWLCFHQDCIVWDTIENINDWEPFMTDWRSEQDIEEFENWKSKIWFTDAVEIELE